MSHTPEMDTLYACSCECGDCDDSTHLDSPTPAPILGPMTHAHERAPWLCDRIDRALCSAYIAGKAVGLSDQAEGEAHDRAAHDEGLMWEAVRDVFTGEATP